MAESLKQRCAKRWQALKTERSSFDPLWREVSDYYLPQSGQFSPDDHRQARRNPMIYDSTGTRAFRTLAAGMMGGMTSPSRPWFRLTTSVPDLDESYNVKRWLSQTTRLMQMVFAKSNTYRMLHSVYEEMALFGTASSITVKNFNSVIWHHTLTIGQYCIAANEYGIVDTLYREFQMTVRNLVREFGYENCSRLVRNQYDRNDMDKWVTVIHTIEPRENRNQNSRFAKDMPFQSVYFEAGGDEDKILSERGFKRFPALCPRWATYGIGTYGYSPGMEVLGDVKQLMHDQVMRSKGIGHMGDPALQIPTTMRGQESDLLPGGVTYYDQNNPQGGVRRAFDLNFDLGAVQMGIVDIRQRIKEGFYEDLFLMLANASDTDATATEIIERKEEKMMMLGPVVERLDSEMLGPLVESTFEDMWDAGIVPEPPPELQGMELNVEFVSMLAQAQRAIAGNSIDRLVARVTNMAQLNPDVVDKIDFDKVVDEYVDTLGANPELARDSNEVAARRQQRASQHQQMQQQQQVHQGSETLRNLSQADTTGGNALSDVAALMGEATA